MARRILAALVATLTMLGSTGCAYQGINSLALPGTQGNGPGAYQVRVEMTDTTNLEPNTPVLVANIKAGSISKIELDGWHAVLTLRLDPGVVLPANAVAKSGQNSLLGAEHLELLPPADVAPVGRLGNGDVIRQASAGNYPATEDVLAAVAALLNGGGLEQLRTITVELNKAVGGREGELRDALHNLATFTAGLDKQKADIISAIEGLNRLSAQVNAQRPVLENALDALPPALRVLNEQRGQLTDMLVALGRFGDTADRVIYRAKNDLVGNLRDLEPAVREVANSGDSFARSLRLLPTVLFPTQTVKRIFVGDYINLFVTVDLSFSSLDQAYLSGTPFQGMLYALDHPGQTQNGHANPLTAPLGALPGAGTSNAIPVPRPPGSGPPRPGHGSSRRSSDDPRSPIPFGQDRRHPLDGVLGGSR